MSLTVCLYKPRVQHSDVAANLLHGPFATHIKALSCVPCSEHGSVENGNTRWARCVRLWCSGGHFPVDWRVKVRSGNVKESNDHLLPARFSSSRP